MSDMNRIECPAQYANSLTFARHDRADSNQSGPVSQIFLRAASRSGRVLVGQNDARFGN
jgi:hypothetical protein